MRRYLPAAFVGVVLIFVTFSAAIAQSKKQSVSEPQMEMPIVAPLFLEDGDFTSTLVLVNGSAVATYADVAVRSPQGEAVAEKRIQFQPYSQQQVSIRTLLQAGTAPNITNGSVTVMQSPTLSSMVIVAALSITQRSSSTPHYLDQELAMPSASGSQMLRGVADRSDGVPLVAITSLSEMAQNVSITCQAGHGKETTKVMLAAEQTLLMPACGRTTDQHDYFHWYVEHMPRGPHQAVGITLSSDGMPGSFAAFGVAPHDSRGGRYFTSVAFTDPMMTQSTTTVFAGVPVGSSSLLPRGNYMPVLTLANFSQAIRHVKVQYALTRNGASASVRTVDTLTLAPSSVQEVTLDRLEGESSLQDSFLVESDGDPADVGVKMSSASDGPLHEVELLGKDLDDPDNGGNHPWTIAEGTSSTLLLFNNSGKQQYFNVNISAGPVVWRKAYLLQPMQTQAISINDLIKMGTKDDKGHMLPTDIWSGQVTWHIPEKNAGRGRILQSNPQSFMARDFSCGYNVELCQVNYYGYVSYLGVGQTVPYGEMDPSVCINNCYGTPAGPGGSGYTYGWSSSNSNIASVAGSSSNYNVSLFGASGGSTYLNGYASDGYCFVQAPQEPVPVLQQPKVTVSAGGNTPYGQVPNISATVSYITSPAPTGSVVFSMNAGGVPNSDDVNLLQVNAQSSSASWPLVGLGTAPLINVGAYTASAQYSGDDNYEDAKGSAAFAIVKAVSSTAFDSCPSSLKAGPSLFTVNVGRPDTPIATGTLQPNGLVTVIATPYSGSNIQNTGNLSFTTPGVPSQAKISLMLPVGTYTVAAHYDGDGNYEGGSSDSPCNVTVVAQ